MKPSSFPTPAAPAQPPSPHPNITISPPNATTLPSYRRMISTLLPIPYPSSFYAASIPPFPNSFALLALWRDGPTSPAIVVAGIQARVEVASPPSSSCSSSSFFSVFSSSSSASSPPPHTEEAQTLYIQTLAVLAPYRTLGIATSLLSALLSVALSQHSKITSLYAHVWEANTDALEWYVRRGFAVEELVAQYYRRLKPPGARVVWRRVSIGNWLKVEKERVEGEEKGEKKGCAEGNI